jgi:cell volume regulation protein A
MSAYAVVLLLAGLLILVSIIASRFFSRFGLSSLLVTLALGMALGNGGRFDFYYNYPSATLHASEIALCVILFAGGFETNWKKIRPVIGQGLLLATIGVFLTTGFIGLVLHSLLGWSLPTALLMGAVVSSTDAAAVFSIFESSGLKVRNQVSEVLELESGTNDPMAFLLTIGFSEMLLQPEMSLAAFGLDLVVALAVGAGSGYGVSRITLFIVRRIGLNRGQVPVLLTAMLLILFALNTLLKGSPFMAMYVAGIVIGNSPWRNRDISLHFFQGMSWLMETVLFLILGLQVFLAEVLRIFWIGLGISALLMLAARPLGVFAALALAKDRRRNEKTFIAWVGLRGATPIVFALVPVVMGVPDALQIFNISFVVVITSLIFQGLTVNWMARVAGVKEHPIPPVPVSPPSGITRDHTKSPPE